MGQERPGAGLDRRTALGLLVRGGVGLMLGCGSAPEGPSCLLTAVGAAGPTWRDIGLRRSDLRWNTKETGADPQPGVRLMLTVRLSTPGGEGCHPLRGARVDVWHCDAQGEYSGIADRGTGGQDFLRGYQVTGECGQNNPRSYPAGSECGKVTFLTVYPGWYVGRTVHVHARVRVWDAYGEINTDVSSQLFFDDAVSDAVHATAPYGGRSPRDTRNATDAIFRDAGGPLVSIDGSVETGLTGIADLSVRLGEIRRT